VPIAPDKVSETRRFDKKKRRRVLLVDDDPLVRRLLQNCLHRQGFDTLEAEDGEVALEVLNGNEVDVLIADVNMPRKSGVELLETVHIEKPFLPVIIITGMPTVEAAVECMKIGAFDYISKPVQLKKLEDTVWAAIEQAEDNRGASPLASPGTIMAGYRVVRTIGEGSAGIVLLVERKGEIEPGQDRRCALKILKMKGLSPQQREMVLQRFLNEAEAAARVQSENVIRFVEYGLARKERIPYLVMEFFLAEPLHHIFPKVANLDYHQKAGLVRQVACGLAAIHANGICHRDVKPGNIMVDLQTLTTKLSDFGIAKLPTSDLTETSNLMGSPAYMAPESFISANVDARADIFSLGIVAYELFLGQRPFLGETAQILCRQITNDRPIAPQKLDPHFPVHLQAILARMLKKRPANRHASANELIEDLNQFLTGSTMKTSVWRRFVDTFSSDWS